DYLKMFATSETLVGKFYRAWTKSTREETEKFMNMFCSQFAALMVMVWDGPLQMNRDDSVTSQAFGLLNSMSGARQLLPGDFDPGDVLKIENGKFDQTYQLQIPYPEYTKYEHMALQQEALTQHRYAKDKVDLQRHCLAKLPSVQYVKKHLPTFMTKMEQWQRENTCDTTCGDIVMEMPVHPGGENVTWSIFGGGLSPEVHVRQWRAKALHVELHRRRSRICVMFPSQPRPQESRQETRGRHHVQSLLPGDSLCLGQSRRRPRPAG
ncbi:unnamed protein product, partial [Symbiodinium sp. KB8]